MNKETHSAIPLDALIIGGGIAGLWLLARLKAQGKRVFLCESTAIGHGQTIASQGIIHGGTKYALTGQASKAAQAIADMPKRWRQALQGQGTVDLSAVKWLTDHQLLWTSATVSAKITGFFASKVMQSRMQRLPPDAHPSFFQHNAFQGSLYQLAEPVLDIPSLLQYFQQQFSDSLIHSQRITLHTESSQPTPSQGYQVVIQSGDQCFTVKPNRIFAMAGEGNQALLAQLKDLPLHNLDLSKKTAKITNLMQRRPLQMLMAKGQSLPKLYAHALGTSDKPLMTITSHTDNQGETVWYIGGEPAEKAVQQTPQAAIQTTAALLKKQLPWLNPSSLQWSSYHVNRAEGLHKQGQRPNTPIYYQFANLVFAWPTKLAFAPLLADQLTELMPTITSTTIEPTDLAFLTSLATPPIATPIWQDDSRISPWQSVT
ncbi:MAG: FAD-dependent oxidoreductase [bacterium]